MMLDRETAKIAGNLDTDRLLARRSRQFIHDRSESERPA